MLYLFAFFPPSLFFTTWNWDVRQPQFSLDFYWLQFLPSSVLFLPSYVCTSRYILVPFPPFCNLLWSLCIYPLLGLFPLFSIFFRSVVSSFFPALKAVRDPLKKHHPWVLFHLCASIHYCHSLECCWPHKTAWIWLASGNWL